MQITIDVNSQKTATKRGTAKATGKPYEITTQRGHLHTVDAITGEVNTVPIDLTLGQNDFPYQTGRYTLDASSIRVDNFGGLAIGRVKLMRLEEKAAPVKAAA